MKYRWIALALLPLAGALQAAVTVNFVNPDKFSDIRDNNGFADKSVLKDIEAYLVTQIEKRVPGRDVVISVTDINLAGEVEPVIGSGQSLRIMRSTTSPSMEFSYEVRDGDKIVHQGKVQLRDMDYQRSVNSFVHGDALRYEKRMIDDWLRRDFAPAVAAVTKP